MTGFFFFKIYTKALRFWAYNIYNLDPVVFVMVYKISLAGKTSSKFGPEISTITNTKTISLVTVLY